MKGTLLVFGLTFVGVVVGYTVAWRIWEANNPGHAPENVAGNYWGAFLGAPAGGVTGLISGTICALLWRKR